MSKTATGKDDLTFAAEGSRAPARSGTTPQASGSPSPEDGCTSRGGLTENPTHYQRLVHQRERRLHARERGRQARRYQADQQNRLDAWAWKRRREET